MTQVLAFSVDDRDARTKFSKLAHPDKQRMLDGIGYIIENSWVNEAQKMGLVDKGGYINSIHHVLGSDHVVIQDSVPYGWFLEKGTRPHPITPVSKKALNWDGAAHPVKKVMHPGTKAYRPAEKGLLNSRSKLTSFVSAEYKRLAK